MEILSPSSWEISEARSGMEITDREIWIRRNFI